MNKRLAKLFTISGVMFLVGGLVGCGSNSSGGGETPPPPPPTPTTKSVTIDFWHTFGQTIQDNLGPQLEQFKKLVKANENVDITINLVPHSNYDSIKEQISYGLKTGSIPTLAVAYPDHVAEYLYEEGDEPGKFMVNLDDYITNATYGLGKDAYLGDRAGDSLSDFIPAYIEGGKSFVRDGTYTFPYMKSTEAMLYNYDAVVKVLKHYKPEFAGAKNKIVQYMNNLDWAEFMKLCEETWKYRNEINPDLKYPAFYDSDSNLFISQLFQADISFSSIVNGKGHIDFSDGNARTDAEALVTSLRESYNKHLFTTKGAFSTYGSDSFKNVESVFTIGSTGGSGYSLTGSFEIGVCKVPPVAGDGVYVSQGPDLAIFKNPSLSASVNKDRALYAWKLIKFLTNPENNCNICLQGSEGYLPVRYSAYEDDLYLEFMESGLVQVDIANVVTDEIDGSYFNTACFVGSADLRKEVGGIITLSLTTSDDISGIFQTAINNAVLKIK